MTGWLIQGVRGEGKSLCAVYKAREYLKRGCVVATNLDLYLDKLLPKDNETLAYRLPDKPRIEDFELIGNAYDPKYKGEDKNGLLILDELGTWLNSRSWSDKSRDALLNWLFLSRKKHWDIILLAQDYEMIDKQAKTTLCDYLVQASRTDRRKIPYIGKFIEKLGANAHMPKEHVYEVFYGLSFQSNPVTDTWRFKGIDLYEAYDTNQLFTDGVEVIEKDNQAKLIDYRSTYTFLPSAYLSGYHYKKDSIDNIKHINQIYGDPMALRTNNSSVNKTKLVLLCTLLVAFLGYRFISGFSLPTSSKEPVEPIAETKTIELPEHPVRPSAIVAQTYKQTFIDTLFSSYKPRLSTIVTQVDKQIYGYIDFYQSNELVEKFSINQLHSLGVSVVKKSYGVDIITDNNVYIVTSWKKVTTHITPDLFELPEDNIKI